MLFVRMGISCYLPKLIQPYFIYIYFLDYSQYILISSEKLKQNEKYIQTIFQAQNYIKYKIISYQSQSLQQFYCPQILSQYILYLLYQPYSNYNYLTDNLQMLQQANKLLYDSKYQQSITLFNQYINTNPDKTDLIAAYYNIAQAYDNLNKYIQAAQYYQKVINLDPTFHNGQVYYQQGQLYQMAKLYKQSKDVYLKYLEFQPKHLQTYYNIGKACLSLNQNQDAYNYFIKAIDINPSYKNAYIEIISILKNKKAYQQIIQKTNAILKYEPNDYNLLYQQGLAMLMLKKYNQAVSTFKQCINFNKTYVKSYLGLGQTYHKLQKYQESLNILKRCQQINKDNMKIIQKKECKLLIGLNYQKMQKNQQALNCYRQVVNQKPVYQAAKTHLIRLLQKQGNKELKNRDFTDALLYYKQILTHSQAKNCSLYNNIGLAYQNINNYQEAQKYFNQVLKIQSKNQEALNNIGTLYKITGRLRQCQNIFKRLAQQFPSNPKFLINYAKLMMQSNKYQDALNLFLKAQKLIKTQDNYQLYNDISVALQRSNRYKQALQYVDKANNLVGQKSPLVLLNRANVLLKLDNSVSAKADFQIAASLLRSPDKSGLRKFGINQLNLKFMFHQLDQYAYLMSPIQTFREGLINDIIDRPQQKFPTVIQKVQKAQQFVLSKIIPKITKPQAKQTTNIEQSRQSYEEILRMITIIKKQYDQLYRQNAQLKHQVKMIKNKSQQRQQQMKKLLRYLPQSIYLRQKLNQLQHTDRSIWIYGKQLYWILNGYLKGYMLISTGVVGKGQNINRSTLNKSLKTIGGILQFAQHIPVIGEFSQLISKICGLFVDMEDQQIIAKVYQVISNNYNLEQDLNDAVCQTVLLFLNDQKKIKRIRQKLIFKPSQSLMDSIKQSFDDICNWFKQKKSQFILHMRGFQKLEHLQQYQMAVIDVGSLISTLLTIESNSLVKTPAITNSAKRVLCDQQMQKMIISSYQRENNNLRQSNNGFCIIMKCQIIYDNALLNQKGLIRYLLKNNNIKSVYDKIMNVYQDKERYQRVLDLLNNENYQNINQILQDQ